jgi:hypothetical protein
MLGGMSPAQLPGLILSSDISSKQHPLFQPNFEAGIALNDNTSLKSSSVASSSATTSLFSSTFYSSF